MIQLLHEVPGVKGIRKWFGMNLRLIDSVAEEDQFLCMDDTDPPEEEYREDAEKYRSVFGVISEDKQKDNFKWEYFNRIIK